jgi:anti-sigma factor RsiW
LSCQQTDELIHGYLDGELDLVKSLEIEKHLGHCHACTQNYEALRSLQSRVSDYSLRYEPPASLEKRLRTSLRYEEQPQPMIFRWRWAIAAASLLAAVIIIWSIASFATRQSPDDVLAQEVVASHVRSLMANHLTDVPSSDRHTVKPWFDGKLDFSPAVKDLSPQGFSLNGGRLDYIGNRPVAALVYQRRQHSINLFVWPATHAPAANGKASERQGYNVIRWSNAGMTYWAVSDLNLAELQQFVQLLQEQT